MCFAARTSRSPVRPATSTASGFQPPWCECTGGISEVRHRDDLHFDDFDGVGSAPASTAFSHARCFASARAVSRGVSVSENTFETWPDTWDIADPTALATPKFRGV